MEQKRRIDISKQQVQDWQFFAIRIEDQGIYMCEAQNPAGIATSDIELTALQVTSGPNKSRYFIILLRHLV